MSLLLAIWLTVVPKGVILVKGATPGTSDASTPLPEQGRVDGNRYHNAYFGLTYPIPAGWTEQPAGPPPSDSGSYVLAQFAVPRANVLLTAQDLFFGPLRSANELMDAVRRRAASDLTVEREPDEVTLGGRRFLRLAYAAPTAGLHWRVYTVEARCHALTFTFTGTDVEALDAAEKALAGIALAARGPACVRDAEVVARTEPVFAARRSNEIPVRVIVGPDGRVKHVHLLSAFPDQTAAILAALKEWRFKPYRNGRAAVPVETGILFGGRQRIAAAP